MTERTIRVYADACERATCTASRCRKPIVFYRTFPRRHPIPIDADARPLETTVDPSTGDAIAVFAASSAHFATCPAVASFRR